MTEPVAEITLERYLLDELPTAEQLRVAELRMTDPTVRRRLMALAHADAQFAEQSLDRQLAIAVAARVHGQLRNGPRQTAIVWTLAAVVSAVVAVVATWPTVDSRPSERVKGSGAGLTVYRNTPAGSETLSDEALAHEGDVIRVGYRIDQPGYGTIVSIDGRGVVSQHLPAAGGLAARLASGGVNLVDGSFQLDDAPDHERFFLVTSAAPFDTAIVVEALRRTGGRLDAASLPGSLDVVTFSLRKESRP